MKIIGGLDGVSLAYRGTPNALDSSRRENYFLLVSQYKDKSGNTINVPVYVNEKGQYNQVFIETNKIATVFGRKRFLEYIQNEVRNGNLVRIKNRSTQTSELAAPIADSYNSNASKNSIRQNSENVNSQSKNSLKENISDVLTDSSRTFADSLTEPTKYQVRDGSGTKDLPDFTAIENKKEITVLCPLQWIPQSRLTINMPEIKENLPQVNLQLHNSLGIINDKSSKNIVSDSGAKVNTFLIICLNFMWKKLSLPKAEILFQEHMNSKIYKK